MTRGGNRQGAGRKPAPGKKQRITISLKPDLIERLNQVENKNSFIAEAVEEKLRSKKMKKYYATQSESGISVRIDSKNREEAIKFFDASDENWIDDGRCDLNDDLDIDADDWDEIITDAEKKGLKFVQHLTEDGQQWDLWVLN